MKKVTFTYYRFRVFKKEIQLQIPTQWKELSPKQFILSARLYMGTIGEDQFLREFFSISKKMVKRLGAYQKFKLTEMVEYLSDARVPHNEFFLPCIPATSLLAPGSKLSGMCFQQFMMVDTYFSRYLISEKEEFLDMMIASLYIKKNERFVLDGEVPSLLKKNPKLLDMENRVPVIRALDQEIKFAIFLNFILIKQWLGKAYQHLFPESDEPDTKPKDGKKRPQKPVDWLSIFDQFVGDNIPESIKYQAMPATNAFRILNSRIRDAKKNGYK